MRVTRSRAPFPGEDLNFPAVRHTIPLSIPFPSWIGFKLCEIAPGLVIGESADADKDLLRHVNDTWLSMIHTMHTVPFLTDHLSHIISVDEALYGPHVAQKIALDLGTRAPPLDVNRLVIDDIFKMLVISVNLFHIFPLYSAPYFITEDLAQHFARPHFFRTKIVWETWQRYADPSGYDLTVTGKITTDDLISAVNVLEKYYRYNGWIVNRVAVALHNFWNALFVPESTLQFSALVTILETLTNLDGRLSVREQMNRNIPKLVPIDAHKKPVTKKRLDALYKARSAISHGFYGRDGHGNLTRHDTHLDAKSANVDTRLVTDVMSITVKMLHRILLDPDLMRRIENSPNRTQERESISEYLASLPEVGTARSIER
jgi:hypothetical protein